MMLVRVSVQCCVADRNPEIITEKDVSVNISEQYE